LKRLDLRYSCELTRIPDLSTSPNIEEIKLTYCKKLIQVHSSIFLTKLSYLCLDDCSDLNSVNIPSNIFSTSPGLIALYGCVKLNMFSLSEHQDKFVPHVILERQEPDMMKEINANNVVQQFNSSTVQQFKRYEDSKDSKVFFSDSEYSEDYEDWGLDLSHCSSLTIFRFDLSDRKFLKKLCLSGCSKLENLPEILDTLEDLKELILDGTAIQALPSSLCCLVGLEELSLTCTAVKELPSSFDKLVNLRSLQLHKCTALESLPNSIVNLKLLSELDCSGCAKLTEIPRHIGRLTSLVDLSLRDSGIVNLPESIARLSSLKSLDLSKCKKLECIPQIPPFLELLKALDCPSIRRVMSNSLVPNLSNSKEGFFNFHLTNAQQLDSGARANIEKDARLRMTDDRYRSVYFCFPGSAVPRWFNFRGKGHSVTINEDLSFCSDDRLTGFALCVVLGVLDTNGGRYGSFGYSLKFESDDDGTQIIPNNDDLFNKFFPWYADIVLDKDHTFVWKFNLESPRASGMSLRLCDARSFTFEISPCHMSTIKESAVRELKSVMTIKECGICPLYSEKKDEGRKLICQLVSSSSAN